VLTNQFYSTIYYGCPIWLNDTNTFSDIRRLNAVHFRALRIAVKDYKRRYKRTELDLLGRARSTTWAKYQAASLVVKAITRGAPHRLSESLLLNAYTERRKPGRFKFYSKANLRIGRQAISNRSTALLNDLDFDWKHGLTDDLLRKKLKVQFKMAKQVEEVVFSTGLRRQAARI